MKRLLLVFAGLLLAGCASIRPAPAVVPSVDSWGAVTTLGRGDEVIVVVGCVGGESVACAPGEAAATDDTSRVVGTLAEVSASAVFVRLREAHGTASIARADVVRLFVVERESRVTHTLIGAAIGAGVCAAAGLYGEGDIVFSGKLMLTGICAGGGAGLGYLANVDPETLRLAYERPQGLGNPHRRSP